MQKENSAETTYLLRHWQENDDSPRFLLEIVQEYPQRHLFTRLSDLMTYLSDILSRNNRSQSIKEN